DVERLRCGADARIEIRGDELVDLREEERVPEVVELVVLVRHRVVRERDERRVDVARRLRHRNRRNAQASSATCCAMELRTSFVDFGATDHCSRNSVECTFLSNEWR